MNNKILRIYILLAIFSTAGLTVFADQKSSATDDKPSVDVSANAQIQVPPVPSDNTSTQTSYLYDLRKLIDKSRQNIKEVNEKIKEQAVLKRNQKREERAREYYEKGLQLTNEGKLDEAREYFEKAIRITDHPEMAGYIKESQRRLHKQEAALQAQERQHHNQIKQDENSRKQEVEEAYREAVDLYKQKKYHPAKDAFDHVDEIAPDYRATDSYLKIIDQDIVLADAQAAKVQAVEIAKQQKEAEEARAHEKAMWMQQIEQKEKERKESIDKQAEEVYDEAVVLYKNKKFAEAKKKFEEVSWVIPDYKLTMKYLGSIDHDAEVQQAYDEQQKQKILQDQRWEETVEEKKKEAAQQKELEVKDAHHKQELEEQAQFIYVQAVDLFDHQKMDAALEKFNDIDKLTPNFKSTKLYIARIQQAKSAQILKDRGQEIERKYVLAVDAYRAHQWEAAHTQFQDLEQLVPDYKHTRRYLQKTEERMAREGKTVATAAAAVIVPSPAVAAPGSVAVVPATVVTPPAAETMPPQVKVAVSLADQQKQAQEIAALAAKSAELYRQIADIADDNSTVQAKRKMAQVDDILRSLMASKQHLLRAMEQEQFKQQEEESKSKQEERRNAAEAVYNQAEDLFRSHEYEKAKIKFLEVENIIPDYKATLRNLKRIEADLKRQNSDVVTSYEKNESDRLKELQAKEDAVQAIAEQEAEEKQRKIEQDQQIQLQTLAQKASDINDAIIGLAKAQDYEGMKTKFTELESTVTALITIKDEMTKQKVNAEREKQLARESAREKARMLKAQQAEDRQIHAYSTAPEKEVHPVLSEQPDTADEYKRHEIVQEQNMLFSEGVELYEHKKYTQAKLLFGELSDQHDRRAEAWLRKVDHAITQELLRSQEGEERERTAFIADQLQAQRELGVIQERERQRQKKLTEELERQKRLYEDDRLKQLRKEELMRAQDRERQRQEQKRLTDRQADEKHEEALRFHKVEVPVTQPAPVQPAAQAPAAAPAPAVPQALSPEQIKAEQEYSDKRKAFLDKKYKEAQAQQAEIAKKKADEEARLAKIKADQDARQAAQKADADARQKRIEERQKERERREQLKAQREADRQARIKAIEDARQKAREAREKEREHQQEMKAEQARIQAEHAAQEEQRRQEALKEEQQEREERMKQEEITRQETEHRQELERQERQQQEQLEAQRQTVRKQLEDGVETMYQEALTLYQQGQYMAAADRFKDIQDIIPGYKRSLQYMNEANDKAASVKPVVNDPPAAPQAVATPVAPSASTSTPSDRQDNVSKALDLFDPNAK